MNDKQKRRLEIVSRIDDDIVEKNTKKRVMLMNSQRRRKWIIPVTSVAAAAVLVLSTVLILVSVLGGGTPDPAVPTPGGKQVPIYQGMTVSHELPANDVLSRSETVTGYNTSGGVKGDQAEHGPVDQSKPFSNGKKPIGDAVKESLTVMGSDAALYYAKAGEFIYITVHVDNPDSFEIISFTLNGYKYANNMFEYGSDLENLILKVQIPEDAEGMTSYTIDAIKYIDGETIKDVRMDGDKTVDIAVYMEEQPTSTLSGEVLGYNSISFATDIADVKGLLGMSESKLYAVLYDGDRLVATKELALGAQTVSFDGLTTNTLYQYAVVAVYDALDGQGFAYHVLASRAVYTKYIVLFDDVTLAPHSVSFAMLWDEAVTNKTLLSLALYQGETKVRDLAVTDTVADGLASDTEYRLVATYQNGTATETIEVIFSTEGSTVTFNSCGVTSSESLLLGAELPTPRRDGFTFAGWFTAEGVQVTTVPAEPVTVFAKWAEEVDASALTYTVSGGKVTVTGLKTDVTDLILPAYIEGCPVTKVSGFDELVGLESIHLPETLTEIGGGAFSGCTALEKIVLPKSLKKSGFAAFDGCAALTRVEYTGSFADWLGITFDSYETDGRSNPVSISKALYIDGVDITDNPPAIPVGTTALGNWALAGFDGLTDVVIPDSVQTVGVGAFSGCDSMTSLTIPVAGVTFNGSVEWMKLLFITEFTADVGQAYAIPAGLKTICLTGNMIDLPGGTFDGFTALETVVLPDTLQTIGNNAFNGCTALSNVNIPTGVTKIGDYAFLNTALTAIDLPNGLLEIGKFAFAGTKLTEIVLPESLQIIQRGAFAQCDRVATLTTPVLKVIFNRGTSMEAYDGLQYLFESYDIGPGGEILCDVPDTLTTVHVIGNMTEFPVYDYDGPFYGFTALTTVTLPDSLQSIGDYAFNGCSALTTVNIPAGVTEIGIRAFKDCVALRTIDLPAGLTKIGRQAFAGCSNLAEIELPAGLQTIGDQAFYGCNKLEQITWPASLTSTGSSTFEGCTSLVRIDYLGTLQQWETMYYAGLIRIPSNEGLKLYINGEDSEFF